MPETAVPTNANPAIHNSSETLVSSVVPLVLDSPLAPLEDAFRSKGGSRTPVHSSIIIRVFVLPVTVTTTSVDSDDPAIL